ncbi:neuropeptide CCHamide-2 receptor-like [Macrosteles quadrilineatus]|uniref:neuropeptide CCHamide-2 receptor-like n=1 Tax=Macrosteles quadrilineatus TaxID=74068 RepID=UPI0023E30C6D|nr:neuropeptide CCHamide-2 receptor-like [Macrosteles quadrilineatus]
MEGNTTLNDTNTTQDTLSATNHQDWTPYWMRLETYLVPAVFALIFILGVVGNGMLIVVFLRHRNMRNVPNIYIFSLALGDLLVIVTCVPFISIIYTFESWPWGERICVISETTKDVSTGVSVFTLTALSVERYCAIVKPMSRHMSTKPLAIITCTAIWGVSFAFAIPAMVFTHCAMIFIKENKSWITVCTPFPSPEHGKVMVTVQFLIYYLIPIIVIGFFYSLMAHHLVLSMRCLPGECGQGQSTQILARKKVAIMVLAFVIIFIICFFPTRFFLMWVYYNPNWKDDYNMFWHVFRIFGFCLAFLNSCVNPIALYFISKAFRKYFNYYLVCCSHSRLDESAFAPTNSSISRRQNSVLLTTLKDSLEKT